MELRSNLKNILILLVGSLIVFHVNLAQAGENSSQESDTSSTSSEGCVRTVND